MPGISSSQGLHQVAQKFRKTTLPLKSARVSGRLSGALTRKSLAGLTGFGLISDSAAAGSPDASAVGAAAAKSESATRRNFTRTSIHCAPHASGPPCVSF